MNVITSKEEGFLKIIQKEVTAIVWLLGFYKRATDYKLRSISGVDKFTALTLLKLHLVTVKREGASYKVTLTQKGVDFVQQLLMLINLHPKPEDVKLEKHIVTLVKDIAV